MKVSSYIPKTPQLNCLYPIVVAETVVGATTGVVPPPRGYLKGEQQFPVVGLALTVLAMKSVCEKYGALFILDEVASVDSLLFLVT